MKSINLNKYFIGSFLLIFCFFALKVQSQSIVNFDCYQDIRLNSATLNQTSESDFEIEFVFNYVNNFNTFYDINVEVNLDPSTNLTVAPFTLSLDPSSNVKSHTVTAIPLGQISVNSNGTIIYIPDDLDLAGSIDFYAGETICSIAELDCVFENNAMDINPENDNYVAPEDQLPQTSNNNQAQNQNTSSNNNNSNNTNNDDNEFENEEDNEFENENTDDYETIKTQFLLGMNTTFETDNDNNEEGVIIKTNDEEEDQPIIKTEKGKRETIILVDEIYGISNIYPNPTKRFAYVEINDNDFIEGNNKLILYNSQLKPLRKIEIFDIKTRISLDRMSAGIYYLKLVNSSKESTFKKLIIY